MKPKLKRLTSIFLTVFMLLTMLPVGALADTDGKTDITSAILCEHSHENCDYVKAVECVTEVPCTEESKHIHDEECGYTQGVVGAECIENHTHEHNTDCGFVEQVIGTDCTDLHIHNQAECGFVQAVEAVEAVPCSVTCTECQNYSPLCEITENCTFVNGHDGNCTTPIASRTTAVIATILEDGITTDITDSAQFINELKAIDGDATVTLYADIAISAPIVINQEMADKEISIGYNWVGGWNESTLTIKSADGQGPFTISVADDYVVDVNGRPFIYRNSEALHLVFDNIILDGKNFVSNTSKTTNGLLEWKDGDVTFRNTVVQNFVVANDGGKELLVTLKNQTYETMVLTIDNSNFRCNTVGTIDKMTSNNWASMIYIDLDRNSHPTRTNITGSTFEDNLIAASSFGTMFFLDGDMTITNTTMQNNKMENYSTITYPQRMTLIALFYGTLVLGDSTTIRDNLIIGTANLMEKYSIVTSAIFAGTKATAIMEAGSMIVNNEVRGGYYGSMIHCEGKSHFVMEGGQINRNTIDYMGDTEFAYNYDSVISSARNTYYGGENTITINDGEITGNEFNSAGATILGMNTDVVINGGNIFGNTNHGSSNNGVRIQRHTSYQANPSFADKGSLTINGGTLDAGEENIAISTGNTFKDDDDNEINWGERPVAISNTATILGIFEIRGGNHHIYLKDELLDGTVYRVLKHFMAEDATVEHSIVKGVAGIDVSSQSDHFVDYTGKFASKAGTGTNDKNVVFKYLERFTVTFDANGGTVDPSSGVTNAEGKLAFLPTPTRDEYSFNGWQLADGTDVTIDTVYTTDTTIVAQWSKNSGGGGSYDYYDITIKVGANGSISPDGGSDNKLSVREYQDQKFTFTPNKGYVVSYVIVDGKSEGKLSSYTFENVRRDHTIEVGFEKGNGHENPQTGVDLDKENHFAYMMGIGDCKFEPIRNITRAEAVCMVNRVLERSSDESFIGNSLNKLNIFHDVQDSHCAYYHVMEATNGHDYQKPNRKETWKRLK